MMTASTCREVSGRSLRLRGHCTRMRRSWCLTSRQRRSTRFCDRVAMFVDGKLAELGTHEMLMEQNGKYAEMFRIQAQYYVEEVQENA